MDKDVERIYIGMLLSHKKEQYKAICNNMDRSRVCHTEWSKSDTERQISRDNSYRWNLKKKKGTSELIYKTEVEDFPSGTVDENPHANARDTGSIPALGRFHVLQNNKAHEPQLLSPWARACELQLLKPTCSTGHEPQLLSLCATIIEASRPCCCCCCC